VLKLIRVKDLPATRAKVGMAYGLLEGNDPVARRYR